MLRQFLLRLVWVLAATMTTEARSASAPTADPAPPPHSADAAQERGQQMLTAAFVYSFARFAEWPADAGMSPLIICVNGDQGVADALAELATGRLVGGRPITVVSSGSAPAAGTCHVLFVGGGHVASVAPSSDTGVGRGVLTIGEGEQFVRAGGIAGLFMENKKMQFIVNADALQRAGLRLSSKLLSLARIFREGTHGRS